MEWMSPVWLGVDGVAVTGGGGVWRWEVAGEHAVFREGQDRAEPPDLRGPGCREQTRSSVWKNCVLVWWWGLPK